MSYMTAGKLQAFEALMKEVPGHNHYDSGCDGICPECRSCCFHRPYWKYQTCVFEECPYPYVWGGSNPSTSFDCSGFVSYVLTNSGLVNTGRLGAQGLYNVCSPVSSADVKPGDLVFFVGTYDTPGVSHVGIYVGDNVMLHCGDPIQYTSINTSYWQSHFYAFGRPNY